MIVSSILMMGDLFEVKLWWAQVIETPEERRINVFNNGTLKGLIILMFKGGQIDPNSIFGDKE